MRTRGEIEKAVCDRLAAFERDYMGRGPADVQAYLMDNLLLVRMHGVLTVAEQQIVKCKPMEKGRDLLKEVRTHLIETARPALENVIRETTLTRVLSMHHDISTVTGEEIVVFTLASLPEVRELKRK